MTSLAVSIGPDAVGSMLWVAGFLVVLGLLALLLSRRGRGSNSGRPGSKGDAQD